MVVIKTRQHLALLLIVFFSATPIAAQEKQNIIDETHRYMSRKLMLLTNFVDSFFGDKKSLEEQNQSRIRFYHILSRGENGPIAQSPGYNIQLKFPNLEKRLQLNLEKEARDENLSTSTQENRISSNNSPSDTDTKGGISFFLQEVYKFNLKFSAGIKVTLDPIPYSTFRISRKLDYNDKTYSHLILETFWDSDRKYGQNASFDLNRLLSDNLSLRLVNDFTWMDSSDTITASQGPTLFHVLSPRRAISYNIRAGYANRPDYRVHSYGFSITYRQNLHKDWFYYDLSPFLNFSRGNNFRRQPGISLKLEISIGTF